jgi:hypothetical protein
LQDDDIFDAEPPREISSRGRIGNPLGAQTVEENFILPPQFDVFQSLPAS